MSISVNADPHKMRLSLFNNQSDVYSNNKKEPYSIWDTIIQDLNEGSDLIKWFEYLQKNVSQIKPYNIDLIREIFNFHWFRERDQSVVHMYIEFIAHLNGAHSNTYIHQTYISLVSRLRGIFMSGLEPIEDEDISNISLNVFNSIHNAIKRILWISPSSATILADIITDQFPHKVFDVQSQSTYLRNILQIADYCPELKEHIMLLAIDKIVQLDVDIKVDMLAYNNDDNSHTLFEVEMEEDLERDELIEKIDSMMNVFMEYLSEQSIEERKETHILLKKAFDQIIVHTHKPKYVQFLIFYFCKMNVDFSTDFLDHLFASMENERISNGQRQTCILYIGSFVARAKYIQDVTAQRVLTLFIDWMDHYIKGCQNHTINTELHKLFYYIYQATCYIIIHAHERIFENVDKSVLGKLGIEEISNSPLNPMKICHLPLVKEFVNVVSKYNLDLKYILERNEQITLPTGMVFTESYFPFDPFFTNSISKYVEDIYCVSEDPARYMESGYLTEGEDSSLDMEQEVDDNQGYGSYTGTSIPMLGSSFSSPDAIGTQSSGSAFDDNMLNSKSPFKL